MQISNHGMKSNARQAHPATPQSGRRGGIFNLDFFSFEKMEIGIWTDICNIFTDSETQGPVLSTAAFYFPSHVPRLHISTIWLATSRLSLSLGNTEERSACIKVTISRIFPPNDCGQKVFIAVEIKNDFRACGISAIIRKFVIESPRLASGRPRLQVEDPAPGDWSVTTRDTGPERRAYIDAIRNVGIHGAHHGFSR